MKIALVAVCIVIFGAWLALTPAGLLGKADAVAYAVCHRIPSHSFFIGDRPVPLCARCSGMYLGALLGLLYQARLGKRGRLPALKMYVVFGLFLLAFTVDGVNSYMRFFPQAPTFYEPHNLLRLLTGTGIGLAIAAVLLPTFNQSMWTVWIPQPALSTWRQLVELLLLAAVLALLIQSENPLAMYPLAILSAMTVLLLLTLVYTVAWTILLKQENRCRTFKEMWPLLLAGLNTAMLQIAVMNGGRFLLTGTWEGFLY
ncbi:MAG TPA: DUF2085 domain-containing protein [Dissulfurispiraceae bacterium]|nr:DUF2085 domain-containing protein [Dissulfurispiraceae bacterium]